MVKWSVFGKLHSFRRILIHKNNHRAKIFEHRKQNHQRVASPTTGTKQKQGDNNDITVFSGPQEICKSVAEIPSDLLETRSSTERRRSSGRSPRNKNRPSCPATVREKTLSSWPLRWPGGVCKWDRTSFCEAKKLRKNVFKNESPFHFRSPRSVVFS